MTVIFGSYRLVERRMSSSRILSNNGQLYVEKPGTDSDFLTS